MVGKGKERKGGMDGWRRDGREGGRKGGREGGREACLADGLDGDLHLAHVVEAVKDAV